MKRIICVLMILSMLVCAFVSCKEEPADMTTSLEGTTAEPTTGDDPETPPEQLDLMLADLAKYKVIYPEGCGSEMFAHVKAFLDKVNEVYGTALAKSDDFYREGTNLEIGEFEIIIGPTNRPESQEFLSGLKIDDYGYKMIGKKLVIAGHTAETVEKAVAHFIENNLATADTEKFFKAESEHISRGTYVVDELKINGVDIREYNVVYTDSKKTNDQAFAIRIVNEIVNISGIKLNTVSDKTSYEDGYEIIVGDSSHLTDALKASAAELKEDEYMIAVDGKRIWITSATASGMISAIDDLAQKLSPESDERSVDLLIENGFTAKIAKTTMSVMSFNVYVGDITSARIERVITMIKMYMPDTFGVQEATHKWMTEISEAIPEYAYVGEGRDGGGTNGEYSAVFYKKDKFNLLDSGTKWLSDTPDVKGSKYPESNCVRIMSYAVLECKDSGVKFIHVNTHLDHISSAAREMQTNVLLEEIEKLPDYPVILTGDFNCQSNSAPYNDIIKDFSNASVIAKETSSVPTFPSSEKIIDFIFYIKSHGFAVDLYKVCNEMINGALPSDHHPIYSEYNIIY